MMTMTIRGVPLFVDILGQGDPLLLMHGGPGLDHTSLLSLRPLADRYTLIFYDHRCNGRSAGAEIASMTWDNLTADAEALRQALGFERWAVLGHSFGGMVAQEYALRYPRSLSHLILMDTGGDSRWVQQNASQLLARRGFSPAAVQAVDRFYNGRLEPEQVFPTALKFLKAYSYHFSLLKLAYEILFGPRPQMRPEAHVFGFSRLFPGWTVMDRLSEIRVPVLVLAGRHDFLYPPEHQAILAHELPNARLELVEQAGHNPQEERPAEVIEVVDRFLAGS